MRVAVFPFDLRLLHPFTTSHGTKTVQQTLLVSLKAGGVVGYGEAVESLVYGVTLEGMCREIAGLKPMIEGTKWHTPEELYEALSHTASISSFTLCALDMAMHDWYGKYKKKKCHELWGLSAGAAMVSSYTIGIDTPEIMRDKMREQAWPLYKIKIGRGADMKTLEFLRTQTRAAFRVDANCGWSQREVIEACHGLRALNVELIEQPLPIDSPDHRRVFQASCLPIIADESCQTEADIEKCAGHFHGVNIKLVKAGGITPALRMIKKAKTYGLKVMVGCMVESSVGISAIAHLLSLLDYVDMDGALLITNDPARGVTVNATGVTYAEENGTGANLRAPLTPIPL